MAEFFGKTSLNCLNNPEGCIGNLSLELSLSLLIKKLFLSFK